jgi:hypothetical protein
LGRKRRLEEIEERTQEIDTLAERIAEEERRIKDLDSWVNSRSRAPKCEIYSALEKVWEKEGHELSPEPEKGKEFLDEAAGGQS